MRRIVASTLLFSSLIFPAAANASSPSADSTASTSSLRISTGVVAPTVLDAVNITVPESISSYPLRADQTVTLSLTVDENGQAHDVQVVKSLNPFWDARVVDAVQQFHFRAGTLDNQPIAMEMNLVVNIER
jgi:TonB family protein